MHAALLTDGYKTFHESAMHDDIVRMYGNFTNRHSKHSNLPDDSLNGVGFVGLQYLCMDILIKQWNETFFDLPKEVAIAPLKKILDAYLGIDYDTSHYEALHDLGYLPIEIKAVPEGTIVPYGVASMTIKTTVDGFQWLALYLETVISTELWPMSTSFTTAVYYMKQAKEIFDVAGLPTDMLPFINHDFSMRGMFGTDAGAKSGFGHLAAGHCGTDTLPSIMFAMKYYGADIDKELVGCSVKATEHSITTSFIMTYAKEHNVSLFEAEVEYARMLLKANPEGVLSYVADSFDFWRFVTEGLEILKPEIMARNGTFVIRPDSGDPEDILCGDINAEPDTPEYKGLIHILAETFGTSPFGKVDLLDSHIGAIYGDSITVERQKAIGAKLIAQGLSPSVVLGVGSYSYQMVTRDTHGSAMKCTAAYLRDGTIVDVCKDPKTDSSKRSAKGLIRLERESGKIVQYDQQSIEQEKLGLLETVFVDGQLVRKTTLQQIRDVVAAQLEAL